MALMSVEEALERITRSVTTLGGTPISRLPSMSWETSMVPE